MAVVGEPIDVGHNTALRRRGAFRLFLFRTISRSYMERRGKGCGQCEMTDVYPQRFSPSKKFFHVLDTYRYPIISP